MNYEQMNNNKVFLQGIVTTKPEFSHNVFGENFYELKILVPRLSESFDELPITVSEKLLDQTFDVGKKVAIVGQFRSYNKQTDNKSKLVLTVFVRQIAEIEEDANPNLIEISGFICKQPIYRTTPFKREIADLLIAVNRAYNKSDYLPSIAWGRNARFVQNLPIGTKVNISGRIQSRIYQKKIGENEVEDRIAYEISICKINCENLQDQKYEFNPIVYDKFTSDNV